MQNWERPNENPAATNSHPIGFSGRREARTIPAMGTAMFTTSLRTFEKLQVEPVEVTGGIATWRSTNINTRPPAIKAIETVPTDQATLEAVLGFIVASILSSASGEGKGGDPRRWGATPPAPPGMPAPPPAGVCATAWSPIRGTTQTATRNRPQRP